jgi:plasmid maintenance system killer protein
MIVSYRDMRTGDFAAGKRVKAFSGIQRSARMKLDRLEAAVSLKDLAARPGNRLEALIGDRKGRTAFGSRPVARLFRVVGRRGRAGQCRDHGERAITGDTALRLGHFFGTSPEFWLNLQSLYELRLA